MEPAAQTEDWRRLEPVCTVIEGPSPLRFAGRHHTGTLCGAKKQEAMAEFLALKLVKEEWPRVEDPASSEQFPEVWVKAEPADDEGRTTVSGNRMESRGIGIGSGAGIPEELFPGMKIVLGEEVDSIEPEDLSTRGRGSHLWVPAAKGDATDSDGAAFKVSGGRRSQGIVTSTGVGLPLLVWNNYKYQRVRTNKTFMSWRCPVRDCGRWLQTDLGQTRVVSEPAYGHTHPSDLQPMQGPTSQWVRLGRIVQPYRQDGGGVQQRDTGDILDRHGKPSNWCALTYSRKTAILEHVIAARSLP